MLEFPQVEEVLSVLYWVSFCQFLVVNHFQRVVQNICIVSVGNNMYFSSISVQKCVWVCVCMCVRVCVCVCVCVRDLPDTWTVHEKLRVCQLVKFPVFYIP